MNTIKKSTMNHTYNKDEKPKRYRKVKRKKTLNGYRQLKETKEEKKKRKAEEKEKKRKKALEKGIFINDVLAQVGM